MNSTTMGFSSHDLSDPHCHIHFVYIRSLHIAVRAVRGRVHLSFCGTAQDVHKDEVARLSKTAQESRSERKSEQFEFSSRVALYLRAYRENLGTSATP